MRPSVRRRKYIREAVAAIVVARIAFLILPARRLLDWTSRPPAPINRFAIAEIDRVTLAIKHASGLRWVGITQLPCIAAAQWMLQRRGIASCICLGVAAEAGGPVPRAWLEVGSQIVLGDAGASRFVRLQAFGDDCQQRNPS